jgi:hypothetical protein
VNGAVGLVMFVYYEPANCHDIARDHQALRAKPIIKRLKLWAVDNILFLEADVDISF